MIAALDSFREFSPAERRRPNEVDTTINRYNNQFRCIYLLDNEKNCVSDGNAIELQWLSTFVRRAKKNNESEEAGEGGI